MEDAAFFVDESISLSKKRHQLVIDATHIAFIEFAKGRFAFFKRSKRELTDKGYIEYYYGTKANTKSYGGEIGSFVLEIDTIEKK